MFRKATLSDLNKAVIEQDKELEELMRNHRSMYQPNHRSPHLYQSRKSNKSALSNNSRSSEFAPDDDMSLTLVKLRIQQEKTNQLQKQYEQEVLRQQILYQIQKEPQQQQKQQQQQMKMTCESPGTKTKKNRVLVIDVPCNTTLVIRSLPADSPQKPSIMKLSNSNKLVQMLKSLKSNKDPSYSNLTDDATIVGDKLSKLSVKTPSSCCSKYNNCDSDISTLDDRYASSSPSSSINSSQYRKTFYYL